LANTWRSGLVCEPTGTFAGLGRADRGIAAALQPGGIENSLTVEDVNRIEAGEVAWPIVRRDPSAKLTLVRACGFSSSSRTTMALLVAGNGPRRKTIGLDRFELGLIEAAETELRLDNLMRDALARQPRTPDAIVASLRRLAAAGALLATWPPRY
jgi:hypothetical protein